MRETVRWTGRDWEALMNVIDERSILRAAYAERIYSNECISVKSNPIEKMDLRPVHVVKDEIIEVSEISMIKKSENI